jgi:cell division protein FtsB
LKILIAALILILIGLQVRLWTGTGSFADIDRLDDRVEVQAEENAALEELNDELYKEVDELKTGMDAIEERARNELGLIKEGETFFLIVEDEE